MIKKRVLVKITGKALQDPTTGMLSTALIRSILQDMQKHIATYQFGIVIGGGNLFRGDEHSSQTGITETAGHTIGMLATTINGVLIKDIAHQIGLQAIQLSALPMPTIAEYIASYTLSYAHTNNDIIIFTGGTGNPYFTTDTTAVIRALQFDTQLLWKATSVDGVFSDDPKKNPEAQFIQRLTYKQAMQQHLHILDETAYVLAQKHRLPIRVFNIQKNQAITRALTDNSFGSIIAP